MYLEAGIYHDISNDTYHNEIKAVSSTRLRDLRESPGHCKYFMENPKKETDSMRFGTQVHSAVLEPEEFERVYVDEPTVKKQGKDNVKVWDDFNLKLQPHQKGIHPEDRLEVYETRDDLLAHPLVRALIEKRTCSEMTILWTDPETGLFCKARPDIFLGDRNLFADLKSTANACEYEFSKSIYDYGYHIQLVHYEEGFKAHGIDINERVLVPFERKKPRRIDTFFPNDVMLAEARLAWRELMNLYAKCEAEDSWPLNNVGLKPIGLPNYGIKIK